MTTPINRFKQTLVRLWRKARGYWQAWRSLPALRQRIASAQPRRIVLGAANTDYAGWVATDIPAFDITKPAHWARLVAPESVDNLLAEHVCEHLTLAQNQAAFALAYRYLKTGGRLRIAVPDGFRRDTVYLDKVRPPADGHQMLWNYQTLREALQGAGFRVELLEYCDEEGVFHSHPYDEAEGFIKRCSRYDRREQFRYGDVFYTSLIVDALK